MFWAKPLRFVCYWVVFPKNSSNRPLQPMPSRGLEKHQAHCSYMLLGRFYLHTHESTFPPVQETDEKTKLQCSPLWRQVCTEVWVFPMVLLGFHDILHERMVWVWRFAFTCKSRNIHCNIQVLFTEIQQNTNYALRHLSDLIVSNSIKRSPMGSNGIYVIWLCLMALNGI